MNSDRSLRSQSAIGGRPSPGIPATKHDSFGPRASSPLVNNRLSALREEEGHKNDWSAKTFSDEDRKYHRTVFERCADPPRREVITNREQFNQALHYAGYDLLTAAVDRLWLTNQEEITFKSFQSILNEEKTIDERALQEAFETLYNKDRKQDWSAVDYSRFRTDMLENGDSFTEEEFNKLRYLLGTDGGKVDVRKLTKTIGDNKSTCREKIITERREQQRDDIGRASPRPNSPKPTGGNNVRIRIGPSSLKSSIPRNSHSAQIKGAFFCEYYDSPNDALYFSIGYSFEIKKATSIWITLEPTISRYHKDSLFKNLDVRLLLFENSPGSKARRLTHISSARSETKTYLEVQDLPKGSYEIIPMTFGGVLQPRTREVNARPPIKTLRKTKKGKGSVMSDDYREALEYVFDLFDFDGNKQHDRNEYNLWTIRTAGDEISDEDWISIRETVNLDVDENISREKFLELNQFEVQNEGTTEQELWTGLNSVGFNYAMELDMMCPFNLTVHINESKIRLQPTAFVEIREIKPALMQFLKKRSEKIRLKNAAVQCFHYQDECGSILFVENNDTSNAWISIEVTASTNNAITLPIAARKPPTVHVRHGESEIVWFAHKLNSQQAMELNATVQTQ